MSWRVKLKYAQKIISPYGGITGSKQNRGENAGNACDLQCRAGVSVTYEGIIREIN